jgi:hypothetical protein
MTPSHRCRTTCLHPDRGAIPTRSRVVVPEESGRPDAARPYQTCEPESRLAGRELERPRGEAPKQKQRLEDEYDRFLRSAPAELSDGAVAAMRALAADLPAVWSAATASSPHSLGNLNTLCGGNDRMPSYFPLRAHVKDCKGLRKNAAR